MVIKNSNFDFFDFMVSFSNAMYFFANNSYFCSDRMILRKQLAKGLIRYRYESVQRGLKFFNLNSATTAGILWTGQDYTAFEGLVKVLEQNQIKWTDLCFTTINTCRKQ
jgi:hypothetical protein